MRRVTTVLVAVGLSLAAAGCDSSSGKPAAKPSASPSKSADPADKFMQDVTDARLDSWSDKMPLVPARDELTVFPPKWCDALEAGHTVQWILGEGDLYPYGNDWGTVKQDAYQLVLLGTQAYCPKWLPQVRDDLRASGQY